MLAWLSAGVHGLIAMAAGLAIVDEPVAPVAQRAIVVKSEGPSAGRYPVGAILTASSEIVLKAGDELQILDGEGTRLFSGPARIRDLNARGPVSGDWQTLLQWMRSAQAERTAIVAGTRALRLSGAMPTSVPRLWLVDPAEGGSWCVADGASITLWRRDASASTSVVVTHEDRKDTTAQWAIGRTELVLPDTIPTETIRLSIRVGGAGATKVVVHAIDPSINDLMRLARTLYGHRCFAQLSAIGPS